MRPIRWETGTVLPDKISHDTLSAREKEYFTKYNEILTEYNDSMNVDLGADMEVYHTECAVLFCDLLLPVLLINLI